MQGAGELNKIYGRGRKRLEIQEQVMALEETINEETHDLDNHHNQGDMEMEEIYKSKTLKHMKRPMIWMTTIITVMRKLNFITVC
ncbi:MAG: hypothetical protein ACK5VM_09025 [Bacteroidota bacterium]